MKIFENSGNFEQFEIVWKYLENLEFLGNFGIFLKNLDKFKNLENLWKIWKILEHLENFGTFGKI